MNSAAGIDTLYFFIKTDIENYAIFWRNIEEKTRAFKTLEKEDKQIYKSSILKDFMYLGSANNFEWFNKLDKKLNNYPRYRIGFKNFASQRNLNDIWIQLEATAIYKYSIKKLIKIIKNDLKNINIKWINETVSRADLNIFVNYDFSYFDTETMQTKAHHKSKIFDKNGKLETVYFGNKKSKIMLKIYNKTIELNDNKNSDIKRNIMKQYFIKNGLNINEIIFNIEFSLKREILKKYDINTIEELLNKANSLWNDLSSRWKILDKNDKYYNSKKNRNRCNTDKLWIEIQESFKIENNREEIAIRNISKQYRKSKNSILKTLIKEIKNYNVDNPENEIGIDEILIYAASKINGNEIDKIIEIDLEIDGKEDKIERTKSKEEIIEDYKKSS